MIWGILIIVLFVLLVRFMHKHAFPPMGTVGLVTGAVKVGKSSFAVWLCVKIHFWRMVRAYIYNFFHKKKREIPLLYSNIPLKYKWYRVLTQNVLKRKERIYYGSVVYINEASLLADSMMYKNEELNEDLMLFCKLFGHSTRGNLIFDTQSPQDCHFAVKRCLNEYIDINAKRRIPFGLILYYRRMRMSMGDTSIDVNVFDGKEDDKPSVFIPFLVWKIFDSYCYSKLTDDLAISDVKCEVKSLKTDEILTFNTKRFIHERERVADRKKEEEEKKKDENKGVFSL